MPAAVPELERAGVPTAADPELEGAGVTAAEDPAAIEGIGEEMFAPVRPPRLRIAGPRVAGAGVPAADPTTENTGVGRFEGTGDALRATEDAIDAGYRKLLLGPGYALPLPVRNPPRTMRGRPSGRGTPPWSSRACLTVSATGTGNTLGVGWRLPGGGTGNGKRGLGRTAKEARHRC